MKWCLTVGAFLLAFSLTAENYFLSVSQGSDDHDGLSPATPWKTLARVQSMVLAAGDTIFLKKGDTWRESLRLENQHGTALKPIVLSTYGEGDKPVLSGARVVRGWRTSSVGDNIYQVRVDDLASLPKVLIINDQWLNRATRLDNLEPNEWFFNAAADILYLMREDGNPDSLNLVVEVGDRNVAIDAQQSSYIVIEGIVFEKANGSLVKLGLKANHFTIRHCDFRLSEGNGAAAGIGLLGNSGALISHNTFVELRGEGVYADPAYNFEIADNQFFTVYNGVGPDNIQIRNSKNWKILRNYMTQEGTDSPKGNFISEQSDNGLLADNICEYGSFGISVNGNNVIVERNILRHQNDPRYDWSAGLYNGNANEASNVIYRNNLVYDCLHGLHFWQDDNTRANYHFYNNTIYNCSEYGVKITIPMSGSFYNNIVYTPDAKEAVFRIDETLAEGFKMDHNLYSPTSGTLLRHLGKIYNTLSSFQATGNGMNSMVATPDFVDAPNADFRLQEGSVGLNAGKMNLELGAPAADLGGFPRIFDGQIDLGAYEVEDPSGDIRDRLVYALPTAPEPIAPTAIFDIIWDQQPNQNYVSFDAARSFDVDGDIVSYRWNLGDGTELTGQRVSHIYTATGTYTVRLTIEDNDGQVQTRNLSVLVFQLTTSTRDVLADQALYVYPNPGDGIIHFTAAFQENQVEMIQLTDLTGRVLKTFPLPPQENFTIDITDLPSGIYLLRTRGQGATLSMRYVKH